MKGSVRSDPAPWAVWAAVGLPTLLFVIGSFSALPYVDPIRDAYQGWKIVHEGHLPLVGPPLAGAVHLGPAWFYLMALPATFASSMLSFSLLVGVLAATKFLLAYRLGAVISDRWFGVCFAALLWLPTWAGFELFFLTHVALVESAILATLLVTIWAARDPRVYRMFLLGLAFGLGLHAHPTYVVVVLPMALLWHRAGRGVLPRHLLAAAPGALIPFVPVFWSLWAGTDTTTGGLAAYAARDLGSIDAWEVPVTLYSLLISGARASFGTVFEAPLASGLILAHVALVSLVAAAGVVGWRHASPHQRRLLGISLLILFGSVILVALMRARTPWYMTFALMPALAACGASALRIGMEARRARWLAPVACSAAVALSAVWTWGYSRQVHVNQVLRLPASSLSSVIRLEFDWKRTAPAIGAWRSGEFGDFLCSEPRLELLGAAGTAADDRVGLDALLACGRRSHIAIGGCSADTTLSLPAPAWETLGAKPARWIAGTGLAAAGQFRCLKRREAVPIATGDVYPFRATLDGASTLQDATLQAALPADHALVIINQFPYLNPMEGLHVTADGIPRAESWSDATTRVYACLDCGEPVEWTVGFRAGRPDRIYFIGLSTSRPVQPASPGKPAR